MVKRICVNFGLYILFNFFLTGCAQKTISFQRNLYDYGNRKALKRTPHLVKNSSVLMISPFVDAASLYPFPAKADWREPPEKQNVEKTVTDTQQRKYIIPVLIGDDLGIWLANAISIELSRSGAKIKHIPAYSLPQCGLHLTGIVQGARVLEGSNPITNTPQNAGYELDILLQLYSEGILIWSKNYMLQQKTEWISWENPPRSYTTTAKNPQTEKYTLLHENLAWEWFLQRMLNNIVIRDISFQLHNLRD